MSSKAFYLIKENSTFNTQFRSDLINFDIDLEYSMNIYDLLSKIALNDPVLIIIDGSRYTINEELLSLFSVKSAFFVPLVIIINNDSYKLPENIFNNIIIFDKDFYIKRVEYIIEDVMHKRIFYKNQLSNLFSRTQTITDLLNNLGITPRNIGFSYLRDFILELMNQECIGISFDSTLYPSICAKHRTSRSSMERSMRSAIQYGWTKGDLQNYLINNRLAFVVKPTIKEFVYTIACNLYNYEFKLKLGQIPNLNPLLIKKA